MWYLESEQVPPISEPIHILNTSRQLSRFPQKWEPNPPLTKVHTNPQISQPTGKMLYSFRTK